MSEELEVDYELVDSTSTELFDFQDQETWLLAEFAANSEPSVLHPNYIF